MGNDLVQLSELPGSAFFLRVGSPVEDSVFDSMGTCASGGSMAIDFEIQNMEDEFIFEEAIFQEVVGEVKRGCFILVRNFRDPSTLSGNPKTDL